MDYPDEIHKQHRTIADYTIENTLQHCYNRPPYRSTLLNIAYRALTGNTKRPTQLTLEPLKGAHKQHIRNCPAAVPEQPALNTFVEGITGQPIETQHPASKIWYCAYNTCRFYDRLRRFTK